MGLTYEETMLIPLCELLDLISVHQIKAEGFEYRPPRSPKNDRDEFMKMLKMR